MGGALGEGRLDANPPAAKPRKCPLLIASGSEPVLGSRRAFTTNSPSLKRAGMLSDVPVPGPLMTPPPARLTGPMNAPSPGIGEADPPVNSAPIAPNSPPTPPLLAGEAEELGKRTLASDRGHQHLARQVADTSAMIEPKFAPFLAHPIEDIDHLISR